VKGERPYSDDSAVSSPTRPIRFRIPFDAKFNQLGQSVFGHRVSFAEQESKTRVPSFVVKSTLLVGSISAPHFPQRSVCVSLISPPSRWRSNSSTLYRSRSFFNAHRADSASPIDDCPAACSGALWFRNDHLTDANGSGETYDSLTELQEVPRYWKSERSIDWKEDAMHELRRNRDNRCCSGEGVSHATGLGAAARRSQLRSDLSRRKNLWRMTYELVRRGAATL
jgi:hypothetical protein